MCLPTSLRASLMGLTEPRTVVFFLPWKRALRNALVPRLSAVLASVSLLLCMVPANALAQQQTAESGISSRSLPDATLPQSGPRRSSAQPAVSAEGSASVAGTVLNVSGGTVSGAEVSLEDNKHGGYAGFT